MQATKSRPRFEVVADGEGIVSHVGAALLSELSDRVGRRNPDASRCDRLILVDETAEHITTPDHVSAAIC